MKNSYLPRDGNYKNARTSSDDGGKVNKISNKSPDLYAGCTVKEGMVRYLLGIHSSIIHQ